MSNSIITPEEIKELAARYLEEHEMQTIPDSGELFCFFQRELPDNRILKDDEGWGFGGYGICNRFEIDATEKPLGKWIIFHFTSLATFPPQESEIRLQPPHIAKGSFQSPDRSFETKIVALQSESEVEEHEETDTEILNFPGPRA